nr:ATP-binding protein [Prevotella sp.]
MKIIARKKYLSKLIASRNKQIIKVITGIRRCGKSVLLDLFRKYLLDDGVKEQQIIYINFENFDNIELRDPIKLYSYIKNQINDNGKMTYILLDEIQQVDKFPEVVDSLFIKKNVDLYITGSNANMLSSELATLLTGRYIEIAMMPLSFSEYVSSTGDDTDLQRKYTEYISFGSFPYICELDKNPTLIHDYMDGIFSTIVLKDIISRKKINDTMMLESVIRFLFDNIGNTFSTKRIADTMTSNGRKIDVKTVEKYISALTESFILYKCSRYNIKGMQYLKTLDKYYVVDMGLRNFLHGSRSYDAGHILENIVYLELLRRGNNVYVGKIDNLEVDFVSLTPDGITYYQVAATVRDERTLERELASLRSINDHYPKYILTLDEDPEADYNGIRRLNVLQWLLRDM